MQSDLPVPTVGAVNDALGLTGVSAEVAQRCSNKILARQRFRDAGVPQPVFRAVSAASDALEACLEIGFPCIVKAPDSSGSRGVVRVETREQVNHAYAEAQAHSRDGRVLVEAFVEGVEFGAQTFSVGGVCTAVYLHSDEVSPPPYMIPIGHTYPPVLTAADLTSASASIARAVEALGIGDGPSNVDVILTPEGEVQVIEIGARIGATCLPELTSFYTGIDWVQAAIESALGGTPTLLEAPFRPVSAYILEAPADGELLGWHAPDALLADPATIDWEVSVKPGDRVSLLRNGTDRIGKVMTTGVTAEAATQQALHLRDSFTFEVADTE